MIKIDILLPCPSCGRKMYSASHDASLSILKKEGKRVMNGILKGIQKISKRRCWA